MSHRKTVSLGLDGRTKSKLPPDNSPNSGLGVDSDQSSNNKRSARFRKKEMSPIEEDLLGSVNALEITKKLLPSL